ncbi:MAG: mevalonate kinase [Chloroflexi bacterium]|nr:mevalonate kinase [Chloroflexota bacterium]MCL5273651.1 mevalonate kinase [Chloroflexota bacterium]
MTTTAIVRTACAKVILCGEHAVVYGRPAIALPLAHLRTRAAVTPGGRAFHISAPDIHAEFDMTSDATRPLAVLARLTFELLGQPPIPGTLTVASDIPPSSHLGSSASVAVACARAIAAFCGHELQPQDAGNLAYEAEKIYHGSPSGIDNTVIAWEKPVWFVKGQPAEGGNSPIALLDVQTPILVIGDTGVATPTRVTVGDVRRGWEAEPGRYEQLFDQIGATVIAARDALQVDDWHALGAHMNANHALLQQLGVSCHELDHLCEAAQQAGALGAKMSGGGRGGNMIALADDEQQAEQLRVALRNAGAARVM